jgi:hypothetical protein
MSSAGRRGFEAFDSIHYVLEWSKWEGIDNMMSPTFPVGEAFTLTPPGGLRVPLGARSKQGFTLSSQGLSGDAAPRLLDRKITIYMFGEFYYKVFTATRDEIPTALCYPNQRWQNCTDDDCPDFQPC